METKIYLPYYSYNDDKFDMDNFYNDSTSYIEALEKYATQDNGFMKVEETKEKVQYSKCDCVLYDENNKEMDIDKLVSYYNRDEMILLIVELKLDTEEEEFDMELNGWVNEHLQLDKIPTLTPDMRPSVEPKRDVKLVVKNKKNEDTYCTLSNTMLLDKIDKEHYVLMVDKIIFTKSF